MMPDEWKDVEALEGWDGASEPAYLGADMLEFEEKRQTLTS